MSNQDISDLFQRAADEAVEAGWSDKQIREEIEEAIERARNP